MNHKRLGAMLAIVAVSFVVTGAAIACGDKLVALGGGVGFERVILSRYPSRIVVLAEPATGLATANEKFNIAASLALAGHDVFLVKDPEELRNRGQGPGPDLILVDAERAHEFQFQPVASGTAPTILSIAYAPGSDGAATAEQQDGCVTVASGRKGTQVLRAVERALKFRRRGLPMPCDSRAPGQHA